MGNQKKAQNKQKKGNRKGGGKSRPQMKMPAQPRTLNLDFVMQSTQTLTESAAGIGADYVFRLNSLYDPNSTGVGSQPVGYDQWASLFLRSVVYKGHFALEFVNGGTSALEVGYYIKSGVASALPATPNAWASQYGARTRLLGTTGRNAATFNLRYDVGRWLGVKRNKILDEEEYSESISGPAVAGNNQLLLYIFIRGVGAVGVAAVRLKQTLTAKMMEPTALALS